MPLGCFGVETLTSSLSHNVEPSELPSVRSTDVEGLETALVSPVY